MTRVFVCFCALLDWWFVESMSFPRTPTKRYKTVLWIISSNAQKMQFTFDLVQASVASATSLRSWFGKLMPPMDLSIFQYCDLCNRIKTGLNDWWHYNPLTILRSIQIQISHEHEHAPSCFISTVCTSMHSHLHVLSPHMPPLYHFATNLCMRLPYQYHKCSWISLMVLRAPLLLRCMRSKGTMSTNCCVGGNVVLHSQIRRAKSTKAMPRRCKN